MTINVVGNNNTVAGRDVYRNSNIINGLPEEMQEEYHKVIDFLADEKNSKSEKKCYINKFKESLVEAGLKVAVEEVGMYLMSLI